LQKAREMIQNGAKRSLSQRDKIQPLRFDSPLIFRDERHDNTWTKSSDNPDINVIDPRTREIRAGDIMDLLHKIYGYDRNYRAISLADEDT